MSDYPVGAKWEGEEIGKDDRGHFANRHRTAVIWLDERQHDFEIWRWKWYYPDGSRPVDAFDWGISYQNCRDAIPFKCRMKRVK